MRAPIRLVPVTGAAAVLLAVLAAPPSTAASGDELVRPGFLTAVSDPGESGLRGRDAVAVDGVGSATFDDGRVYVSGRDAYSFMLAGRPGEKPQVGTYDQLGMRTRPGLEISDCYEHRAFGRVEVLDVAYDEDGDLARLDAVYEHRCGGLLAPAIFGQVRTGYPEDVITTAPTRIRWPETPRAVDARSVPVTIRNTGTAPATVGAARVSGADASSFVVGASTCPAVLPAGARCVQQVTVRPARAGVVRAELVLSLGGAERRLPLEGAGSPGSTSFSLFSEPGQFIGAGSGLTTFAPPATRVTVERYVTGLVVRVGGPVGPVYAEFLPKPGEGALVAGRTYFRAVSRYDTRPRPTMSVSGGSRACSRLIGAFTVHELEVVGREVTRLALSFVQHCAGSPSALRGAIAFRADTSPPVPPAGPLPDDGLDAVPPPAAGIESGPSFGHDTIRFSTPLPPPVPVAYDDEDFSYSEIRWARGAVPPATVTSGVLAVRDAMPFFKLVPEPRTTYALSHFARDLDGNVSAPSTLVLEGTALALKVDRTLLPIGQATGLTVHLRLARVGTLIADREVVLETRSAGTTRWQRRSTGRTDARGFARFSYAPAVGTDVRVRSAGEGATIGAETGTQRLRVVPALQLHASAAPSATTSRLVAQSSRGSGGAVVVLQRFAQGSWVSVLQRRLGVRGDVAFVVPNGTVRSGATYWRVVSPSTPAFAPAASRPVAVRPVP